MYKIHKYSVNVYDLTVHFWFDLPMCKTGIFTQSMHKHPYLEIQYVTAGSLSIKFDDSTIVCNENVILLVPPHTPHCPVFNTTESSKISIGIELTKNDQPPKFFDYYNKLLNSINENKILDAVIPEFAELSNYFVDSAVIQTDEINCIIESYFKIVFFKIFALLSNSTNVPNLNKASGSSDIIADIFNIVSYNYNKPLSLSNIAKDFNISTRQLERIIKAKLNTSFLSILNERRINIATLIINNHVINNKKVHLEQISQDIGYNNYNYFSKQFKKYTGITPTQFISELKNKT